MVGFNPLTNNHFFNLHGGLKNGKKESKKEKSNEKESYQEEKIDN
jgi:hypothetical protein